MKRWLRVVATLVVSALAVAYIVLKIDLGKTLDILALGERPLGDRVGGPDARHGAADGLALAAAARRPRRPRARAVADAHVLRLVRLGADPADRRSAATRRASSRRSRRHPGHGHADHGLRAARARARRRRHAAARRRRLPARDRALPDRRLPLARGDLRRRRDPGRVRLLLARRAQAAHVRAAGGPPLPHRASRAGRLRGDPRLPRPPVDAARRLRRQRRVAVDPRARDLRVGPGGRHPPLGAAVHRARAAALPRHARAVHRQRARRARGVLRQLPRQSRRERRRGVRLRLPLLRDDDPARAARARRDPLGAGVRPAAPRSKGAMPERSG